MGFRQNGAVSHNWGYIMGYIYIIYSQNFKVDDLFCCLTMVSPCQRRFPETSGLKEVKSAMPIGKQLWCCDKRSYKMSIEQVRGIIHIYIYFIFVHILGFSINKYKWGIPKVDGL
jgi:hypothetical protein